MFKKILYTIINVLSVIIIIAAVFVLLIVVMTKPGKTPSIAGYMALRVTTGSMAPTYDVDSLIIVKLTDPSAIKENDVISFYSSDPALSGAVNTHRVVSIETDGNNYRYITKGDANNVVDRYDVDSRDLLGKVVWSSLILGKIVRLVSNPLIFVPIILVPLAIILIANLVKTVSYARKIAKDEEEAAVKEAIQYIREKNLRETGDTTESNESSERKSE